MWLAEFQTGFITTLATKFSAWDTSMYVATAPTITAGRIFIKSWTTKEWIKYTGVTPWTPAILTGCVRQLDTTTDPAVSLGNGYTFLAGTQITFVAMGDQFTDKQALLAGAHTWASKQTFWDVDINWVLNMWAVGDLNVLGTSNPAPVVVSAAARDALYPSPVSNDRVYRSDLHAEQIYDTATATWNTQSVGTPTPNAAVGTAGIVQIGTSLNDVDSSAGIYNMTPNSVIRTYISTTVPLSLFWDGSDGDVTISGNTSLSKDMYYNNLTVNNSIVLTSNGYRIFVKWTLTNNGTIRHNGWDASTSTAGTGAAAGTLKAWSNGGTGWAWTQNTNGSGTAGNGGWAVAAINPWLGSAWAKGWNGWPSSDQWGGTGSTPWSVTYTKKPHSLKEWLNFYQTQYITDNTVTFYAWSNGGWAWASWASHWIDAGANIWRGWAGWGWGWAGGIIYIIAKTIVNNWTIESNGWAWWAGSNSINGTGNGWGGWGWSGGTGGVVILMYTTNPTVWTVQALGGTLWAKGLGYNGATPDATKDWIVWLTGVAWVVYNISVVI